MTKSDLQLIQQKISYDFSNPRLLEQAFTTRAFALENPEMRDYELLEFFGDKILSFVLAKEYADYFCKIKGKQLFSAETECSLTQRNCELIKNENLSLRVEQSGLDDFFQKLPAEKIFGKRKADLFEAILGAVAVDSNWDTQAVQRVVDSILNPAGEFGRRDFTRESFIVILKRLCKKYGIKITVFQIAANRDNSYTARLTLECDGCVKKFRQKAKTEIGAKLSVARTAYLYIKKFWLFQPAEEWIENPVSQLNSLRQNRWIQAVKYECIQLAGQEADKDGKPRPEWSCTCTVDQGEGRILVVSLEKPGMKKAKNAAALKALCMILNQMRQEQTGRGKGLLRLILERYL